MSKDRKKRKEGKKGSNPNSANNSPPSDPVTSNIRPKPDQAIPMDTSNGSNN